MAPWASGAWLLHSSDSKWLPPGAPSRGSLGPQTHTECTQNSERRKSLLCLHTRSLEEGEAEMSRKFMWLREEGEAVLTDVREAETTL